MSVIWDPEAFYRYLNRFLPRHFQQSRTEDSDQFLHKV